MKNRIIAFILLVSTALFAENLPTVSNPTGKITSEGVELDPASFIEEKADDSTCKFQCPKLKSEYFSRIRDIIPIRGETQCSVYSVRNPSVILGYVTSVNAKCQEKYSLTESEEYKIVTDQSGVQTKKVKERIRDISIKYKEHFANTGTREFIRASKYLVAGITADDEIVDIENTVLRNKLTLNSNYTIYPNLTNSLPDATLSKEVAESQSNGFLDSIENGWSSIKNIVSGDEEKQAQAIVKVSGVKDKAKELISLTETLFSSIIALVLSWLSESNQVILEMNTKAFFLIVPFTAFFLASEKISKAVSQISDHESLWERGFMSAIVIFTFYINASDIKVDPEDSEKNISQTNFMQWSRPILYSNVAFADKLTFAFADAYLGYKLKDAGVLYEDEYKRIHDQTKLLEKENTLLNKSNGMLGLCYTYYDTDTLASIVSPQVGTGTVFPPLGALTQHRDTKAVNGRDTNKGINNLDETSFLKKDYRRENNIPTLGMCYNVERRWMENKKLIAYNQIMLQRYDKAKSSEKNFKAMELIAKMHLKNTQEMGFLNASMIASTEVFLDNADIFDTTELKEAEWEKSVALESQGVSSETGQKINGVANGKNPTIIPPLQLYYSGMHWLTYNMAYMMIPPATSIKENLSEAIIGGYVFFKDLMQDTVATALAPETFGLSFIASKIINMLGDDEPSPMLRALASFLALIITILIMRYFLSYLPLVAINMAFFWAIGFYYISVEIFYLISPFIAIYALSTNQIEVIKSFLQRFLALSFKPVLIVVSVVIAIFANELIKSIGRYITHKTFDTYFTITAFDRSVGDYKHDESTTTLSKLADYTSHAIDVSMQFTDYGLVFFKGMLNVGTQVLATLIVFYLVFYGATMILNMFGMKDSGIDAQDSVGQTMEGRTSRYNTSI